MENLIAENAPNLQKKPTTQRVMIDILIALAPAAIAAVVFFGMKALLMIALCVSVSVLSEFIFNLLCKRKQTVGDLTAAVTGLLLALSLPTNVNVWQCIVGSVFAIVIVKCAFGGLGYNFANPSVTAKVMLIIAFSLNATGVSDGTLPSVIDMLIGRRGGAIGETCAVALIAGGIYLLVRKVISWEIPVSYIGSVFALSFALTGDVNKAIYHTLGGGLVLGAIFMATDPVTSPKKCIGKIIFGLGCGVLTVMINFFGTYSDGVPFAILIMNMLVWYIDKVTMPRRFGGQANGK
jgi:electron transport complex protein RnfD